jgi:hypothetical protein
MKNDYKKIQEKIEKAVMKNRKKSLQDFTNRNSVLYKEYEGYMLMTAYNHQEYFIPKDEVDDTILRAYGSEDIDSMVGLTDRVMKQSTCVLKYLGVYKTFNKEYVLFEGENDKGYYKVAFDKKVIAAIKYDVVYGGGSLQPALFYNEGIPVLLQAPCVLSRETLDQVEEELNYIKAIKHFKIKL